MKEIWPLRTSSARRALRIERPKRLAGKAWRRLRLRFGRAILAQRPPQARRPPRKRKGRRRRQGGECLKTEYPSVSRQSKPRSIHMTKRWGVMRTLAVVAAIAALGVVPLAGQTAAAKPAAKAAKNYTPPKT